MEWLVKETKNNVLKKKTQEKKGQKETKQREHILGKEAKHYVIRRKSDTSTRR